MFMKNLSYIVMVIGMFLASVTAHAAGDNWLLDFEEAKAQAKAGDKHILVEFHGSDWCPPCKKLNKEVLTQDAFKSLAESSLVLVNADFPRRTKLSEEQQAHNDKLAEQYGVQYFPTVLIMDQNGKVLDKLVGFPESGLDGFITFITDQTGS